MKNKKKLHKEGNSLKTFFLYGFFVLILILISISIKAIYVFGQSKYDGKNFIVALIQKEKVVKVVGFDTTNRTISVLDIKNSSVSSGETSEKIGLVYDAVVATTEDISGESIDSILSKSAWHSKSLKSDLTIFDKWRLILLANTIQDKDRETIRLNNLDNESEIDGVVLNLFKDNKIISENLNIQIINSTDIPGLGKKLERIVINMGGNVVSVSNSRDLEKKSKIQYTGDKSYTLDKFKKLFKLPVEKIDRKAIADVIILIGEDYKKIKAF